MNVGTCSDETRLKIIHGEYQMVFISTEVLLSNQRWRKILLIGIYQGNLVGVVIDELHCVRYWYGRIECMLV